MAFIRKYNIDRNAIKKYSSQREIDYLDIKLLKLFLSPSYSILSRNVTGVPAIFQRRLAKAVKRARFLGLLPFTDKHAINLNNLKDS